MIAAHFKDKQDSQTSIGAYSVAFKFVKDYIVQIGRLDVEFSPLFNFEDRLTPFVTELEEIDLLKEGPISELVLGYIYKWKNSQNRKFFRARQKHLVHTSVLQKIIAKVAKPIASEQIKE
ncbi:unnamed protein product [Lactuca saligna]|uniref:Uncharacterized protein n=1 Tax=Lactuca saligna TaxID=75948 RepID=A0AA35ZDJ5_LACSI|nr:unnamed protein product [Lactuca saligna]